MVIVGSGHLSGDLMANMMVQHNLEDKVVTVVSSQEDKQLKLPESETYLIYEPPPFISPYVGKEFYCKGKHQYREVKKKITDGDGCVYIKVDWVCQCGRKL